MITQTMSESWKAQGVRHWLVTAWQEGLRRALESMVGAEALAAARFQALIPEPDTWQAWPAPLWCQMSLGAMMGAVSAGFPRPTVQMLGRLIAGDPQLADPDCDQTVLELINQVGSAAAETLSVRMDQRQQFSPAQVAEPPATLEYPVQVELLWEGILYALAFVPSPQLMEAVAADNLPTQLSVLPPAPEAPAAAPANLDLLLEVELPVVVTFGRTQLPLKDVLKLSSGSIVELNRLANEPVEVLINNSVIARGEVVVVDGNYGIRVTEIVSRQERIRSIF